MKRDMDLIRKLLLVLESSDGHHITDGNGHFDGYDSQVVAYHWTIMHEAGLIEGSGVRTSGGLLFMPSRLTWNGHDFLDKARDDGVWNATKATLGDRFAQASFDVLGTVLTHISLKMMGLS